jgi:4'-phosphopantetheinyl transferase EntD
MPEAAAARRDTWPNNVVRSLAVLAGWVLALVAGAVGSDSDGLAMDAAMFFLITLDPWRPA